MVETPEVYIFGRIHGSTSIAVYSQTRMEDIEELKKPLEIDNGVEIYDIMRLFKGDGPSCQVEAGQQKGGNYFCWICRIHCVSSHDFAHAAYRKWLSFEDRQKKVLSSHRSIIEKSKEKFVDLYSNLKKGELVDELDERGIKYSSIDNVADLKKNLSLRCKELRGFLAYCIIVQRKMFIPQNLSVMKLWLVNRCMI